MALQVELIPTGEIIRVVHPHRPCKLVSWGMIWAGRKGGNAPLSDSSLSDKPSEEKVISGEE